MTRARQLEMVPLNTRRGEPLLAIRVAVPPQSFERPRPFATMRRVDGQMKPTIRMHDHADYTAWKRLAAGYIELFMREKRLERIAVPFIAKIEHVFSRPASPVKRYTLDGVPHPSPFPWTDERVPRIGGHDLDNLNKAMLDALTWAAAIADDRLCVEDGGSRKVYAAVGEEPCVEVRLWRA